MNPPLSLVKDGMVSLKINQGVQKRPNALRMVNHLFKEILGEGDRKEKTGLSSIRATREDFKMQLDSQNSHPNKKEEKG